MLIDFFITEPETIVIVSWNAEEDAPVVARRERGARCTGNIRRRGNRCQVFLEDSGLGRRQLRNQLGS
jgi:hypothetical protein